MIQFKYSKLDVAIDQINKREILKKSKKLLKQEIGDIHLKNIQKVIEYYCWGIELDDTNFYSKYIIKCAHFKSLVDLLDIFNREVNQFKEPYMLDYIRTIISIIFMEHLISFSC